MKCKERKLNAHETYACSSKAVKNIFANEDVYINFGFLGRDFKFDSLGRKRPQINGIIVASALINKRENMNFDSNCIISFYAIKDLKYSAKNKKDFSEVYLPLIYKWYKEILGKPETSVPGIENILIEWSCDNFKVHCYRYH